MSTFWCETAVIVGGGDGDDDTGLSEVATGVRVETIDGRISAMESGAQSQPGDTKLMGVVFPAAATHTRTPSTGSSAEERTTGAEIFGCGGSRCTGVRRS